MSKNFIFSRLPQLYLFQVRYLEHVQCKISLKYFPRGSLKISLRYCTLLYCTELYCTVLYCTVLCFPRGKYRQKSTNKSLYVAVRPEGRELNQNHKENHKMYEQKREIKKMHGDQGGGRPVKVEPSKRIVFVFS